MPAFEWVHVQLHQQKGMISLSPPTICNSALIGTCRLNGIDPEAYLRHILSVLPEWPSNKVAELLPWNVVLTDK
ncbi:transposase domain-containing protein [Klebsiella pneumoniae]|uniref:transposase domain-containing protein n=1 Tax=Klebsiella pneumoniae TaxID=573 RepID=UPI001378CBE6|nr:transposase domain-containing protein [Klebsiella pneumoniae]NBD94461.1 hypothetical protein [Klebsiella pneumoniae]